MGVGLSGFLGSPVSLSNSGKSQINFNFPNGTAEYPFMNLMKVSGPNLQGSGTLAVTPDICDSNGWMTAFPTGATNVYYVINMPSQNERPGNYDLTWTGNGVVSFTISGGMALVSGSLTPSGGVGHAVVVPNSATVGPGGNDVNMSFNGPAQNIQFCHVDDLTPLSRNPNEFHPKFISVLRSLKPGVLRFLNWLNGNQTGLTTWASRCPLTYSSFAGGQLVASAYAGASSASGSDLSVGLPPGGFTLADKVQLQFYLSATPPIQATGTFASGASNVTMTAHGLATNNQVYLTGTAPAPFTAMTFRAALITTYFVTVVDANTIRLSATKGGSAINAGANGSCTINPYPTVSVNGGPAIPLWSQFSIPFPQSFTNYPTGGRYNSLCMVVYDATFGAFVYFGGGSNNVPPEVCLDLCHKVGAHPWLVTPFLALDPASDWLTQLGQYVISNYSVKAPWMIPRFETPNECWNVAGTFDTQYAAQKAISYGWGANNWDAWIGKVASIGGQQLANVFGGGNLGMKYHWIVGVQTFGTISNDRLASTTFLSSDPNPVQSPYGRYAAAGGGGGSPQNWVSHICVTNYVSPLERYTCQELIDAYAYSVTNAGNSIAQETLANSYVNTLVSQRATVTITSGSTNISWTSHGRSANDQVVFLTAPPSGFTIGTSYYVKTVVDANTITLSATSGGTVITPTGSGTPTLAYAAGFNVAHNYTTQVAMKAWAAGYGVNRMAAYEGGYSPDYLGGNWSTGITGATQAASCVLTLASTSGNSESSGFAGNPAVVGMSVSISGVGGMTQLNGNTYAVSAVSGNLVTINVNSTGFSAYTSGGTVTYVNSQTYSNALRGAGKGAPNLQGYLTQAYNNFIAASGEFPSCFQLGSNPPVPGTDVWSILDDIYQPFATSSQARAIQVFNS